jgi:uncharacterized membrane protein
MSSNVKADVQVDVPVRVAYDQWTQFESFPNFMSGVDEIRQQSDTMTHWVVSIGGVRREFDAKITEQVPDTVVAWESVDGPKHRGRVVFRAESAERTYVEVSLEWEPADFVEKVGAALQIDDLRVKRDLEKFKRFIEERGVETGAWRGEVHDAAPGGATGAVPPVGDGAEGMDPDLRA